VFLRRKTLEESQNRDVTLPRVLRYFGVISYQNSLKTPYVLSYCSLIFHNKTMVLTMFSDDFFVKNWTFS
jgi:hypothetical protein